ncbi:hypothetical protein MBLNU457_g0145t2 [Dothideomycetes sp. NU457]
MAYFKSLWSKPPGYVTASSVVSIAGFLGGYDTGSIGAVTEMPFFLAQVGDLSPIMRGITVAMIMLTGIFPAFFVGQLADRYGRLAIISTGAFLFAIGGIMQAGASTLTVFNIGRALYGLGMSTWLSTVAVYISEIAPSARRGTLVAVPQLMTTFDICAGYFTCYGSSHLESNCSWRMPAIISTVLAGILSGSCFFLPQSPRWLLWHNQRDKAIREMERLDFNRVEAEKDFLGPAAAQRNQQPDTSFRSIAKIFKKEYRSQTGLALLYLGMCQLSGIDGVLYAGLPAQTSSFIASGVSALLMLAITVPALLLVDRFTRRSITLTGGLILTFSMFLIGILYASHSVNAHSPTRYLVIILVFVFSLTYAATWAVVAKIYASEIQPAETRSAASCVAQGMGFFTNWLVAVLTPFLLAKSSFGAYFLFGGFCIASIGLLYLYMPETRGLSLEDIERVFAGPAAERGGKMVSLIKRWLGRSGVTTPDAVSLQELSSDENQVGLNEGSSSGATRERKDVVQAVATTQVSAAGT